MDLELHVVLPNMKSLFLGGLTVETDWVELANQYTEDTKQEQLLDLQEMQF